MMTPLDQEVKKFKDLTEQLVPRLSAVVKTNSKSIVEYDVFNGNALGIHLFNSPRISINRFFATKDAIFPEHSHKEKEWCILYEGSAILKYEDREVILKPGDCAEIEPNTKHSAVYLENSWLVLITIPRGEGMANDEL